MMSAIVKSATDKKEYEITLLPSGLEALLIKNSCDATYGKSAAAISVHAGSFADPIQAEGCAHFLEHMVFMGSKKYPEENRYDSFVNAHGGSCNAFTEGEYTTYQFDISSEYFAEALDIFAQCFIAPLLSFSSSERELNAIQNEFMIASVDDGARCQEIINQCGCAGHVVRQFSWGNKRSLLEKPKLLGLSMQELLLEFHRKHYQPHHAKLAIITPHDMAAMKALVDTCFGDWIAVNNTVSSNEICHPAVTTVTKKARKAKKAPAAPVTLKSMEEILAPLARLNPFPHENMHVITRIVAQKQAHKLTLSWQLPPHIANYKSKPLSYISHLLGHEGAGSMLAALKKLNYATGLSAGCGGSGFDDNSMFSLFSVTVYLSTLGLANWMYVVQVVTQYVAMLRERGPQVAIFEEIQNVALQCFAHGEEEEESDLVERLSIAMLPIFAVAREDLLTSSQLLPEWDSLAISRALERMTPQLVRVDLLSPLYKIAGESVDTTDAERDEDKDDEDEDDAEDDNQDDDEDDDEESDDDDDDDAEEPKSSADDVALGDLFLGPAVWLSLVLPPCERSSTSNNKTRDDAEVEKHFGTTFWVDKVCLELEQLWSAPLPQSVCLHLPDRNPFIASQWNIVAEDGSRAVPTVLDPAVASALAPKHIYCEGGVSMWHLNDTASFPQPKVDILVRICSADAVVTCRNAVLHDLSIRLFFNSMSEIIYMAALAELSCDMPDNEMAHCIRISGFSDKALVLLEAIMTQYWQPGLFVTDEGTLARLAEQLARAYANQSIKSASVSRGVRLSVLKPSRFHCVEKLESLKANVVTLDEMLAYCKKSMKSFFMETLVQGNCALHDAISMASQLNIIHTTSTRQLDIISDAEFVHPEQSIININSIAASASGNQIENSNVVVVSSPQNPQEKNVSVEVYLQLGLCTAAHSAMIDLLEQLLTEPYFDDLRTRQQIGYSVNVASRRTFGVLGFCLCVLSSSHTAQNIVSSIMEFARKAGSLIASMTATAFADNLNALIHRKLQPDKSRSDVANRHWYCIEERTYQYNFHLQEVEMLRDVAWVSQLNVVRFCEDLLMRSRALIVLAIPPAMRRAAVSHETATSISTEHAAVTFYHQDSDFTVFDDNYRQLHAMFNLHKT